MDPTAFGYAYLHGFASTPLARKGALFGEALARRGATLEIPDLNAPSFRRLDHRAILARLDGMDRRVAPSRWRLIGSSFGGWVAARWAALRPDRVDRLVLLCPGFGLAARWQELLGDEAMATWRSRGELPFERPDGRLEPLWWRFYEQSLREPAAPDVPVPSLVLHGVHDDVVPIASSRRWVARQPDARLVELDDGHPLLETVDRVIDETLRFFGFDER
ncbi:MAG: alpha/beta fold hydrolase [Acidobacteriota bacterium]